MTSYPSVIQVKVVSVFLLLLTLLVPITGFVAVRAYTTANVAACTGANDAKEAVEKFVSILIDRAEAPIANATPEQLARQRVSVAAYKQTRRDAARLLAREEC